METENVLERTFYYSNFSLAVEVNKKKKMEMLKLMMISEFLKHVLGTTYVT
jgi:hypothetical protein